MVFSVDTVLDSQNKISSTMLNEEIMVEKSSLDEALEIIAHENEKFNSLFEGCITEGIMDKISQFDFSTVLSKIFDLFISAIGRLAGSFGAFLLNFVNKDAQLKLFKSKLANYRGSVRYTKPYYTYTHIKPDTMHAVEYKRLIGEVYSNFTTDFTNTMSRYTSPDELISAMENKMSEGLGSIDSPNMNHIRATLVDSSDNITSAQYRDELFKYFRNGEVNRTEPTVKMLEKNIDGTRIGVAYNDYCTINSQISAINRESSRYKAEATAAKTRIRTFNPFGSLNKSAVNSQVVVTYNRLVSANCREIRNICDAFTIYFAAKIDALKEYNRTNKEILLLACKQMTRESGNND